MRLALINPPQPYLVEKQTQVPLGLLYLAAVLKRDCPEVNLRVVDTSPLTIDEAVAAVGEVDVYGFTCTSLDYHTVRELKERLTIRHPTSLFILGGPHAAIFSEEVLKDGFDHVFVGEAEETLPAFLQARAPAGQCVHRATSPLDITTLPWPDRDALSWVGGRVLHQVELTEQGVSANIMASRGCPYSCSFCASEVMWHRRLRWRTPEDVVGEIKHCIDKYEARVFRFSDDNMVTNKKWIREFCSKVADLKIRWVISARVDGVTPDLLEAMAGAGCAEMAFGVESFDPMVLKALRKRATVEQAEATLRMAFDAGILPRVLMMISTPGETYRTTVDMNIEALERLKPYFSYLRLKIFKPLPGTQIWEEPSKFGITIDDTDLSKYNFYIYRLNNEGQRERYLWSPISFECMTKEQQTENIRRMVDYSETLDQNAMG